MNCTTSCQNGEGSCASSTLPSPPPSPPTTCPTGEWSAPGSSQCTSCTSCPPGQPILHPCKAHSNTQCDTTQGPKSAMIYFIIGGILLILFLVVIIWFTNNLIPPASIAST